MAKTCICSNCSFARVCEYRSTTKKHCIDYNDAISNLYTDDALRARLKDDRKTEFGMAVGFIGFLVFIALCVVCKEIFTQDGWLLSVAWPAIWNCIQPIISIVLNGFVAIVHLTMVLIMVAGAVLIVVWCARSIYVIAINIQRKIAGGNQNA